MILIMNPWICIDLRFLHLDSKYLLVRLLKFDSQVREANRVILVPDSDQHAPTEQNVDVNMSDEGVHTPFIVFMLNIAS